MSQKRAVGPSLSGQIGKTLRKIRIIYVRIALAGNPRHDLIRIKPTSS
jgi:hypothetical protein